MARLSSWIAVALALGCAEAGATSVPPDPPPVTPVEVPALPAEAAGDELATLRARVAELERELEACRSAQAAAPAAAIPEGADPPEEAAPASARPEARARDAGARARRAGERSLSDLILGDDVRPRRRGETIELPDPARILLGE